MYHLTADSEVVFFLSLLCGMGCWYIFFVEVWADAIAWVLIWGGEILKSRWAFGGSPGFGGCGGGVGLLLVRQFFTLFFYFFWHSCLHSPLPFLHSCFPSLHSPLPVHSCLHF